MQRRRCARVPADISLSLGCKASALQFFGHVRAGRLRRARIMTACLKLPVRGAETGNPSRNIDGPGNLAAEVFYAA